GSTSGRGLDAVDHENPARPVDASAVGRACRAAPQRAPPSGRALRQSRRDTEPCAGLAGLSFCLAACPEPVVAPRSDTVELTRSSLDLSPLLRRRAAA